MQLLADIFNQRLVECNGMESEQRTCGFLEDHCFFAVFGKKVLLLTI